MIHSPWQRVAAAGLLLCSVVAGAEPKSQTDKTLLEARRLAKEGKYPAAIAAFDRYIAAGNRKGYVYYERGQARVQQWRKQYLSAPKDKAAEARRAMQPAIDDFKTALRLYPELLSTHESLGEAYDLVGEHRLAVAEFTILIGQPGIQSTGWYDARARARRGLGDYKGAVADLTAALRMAPDKASLYYNRGGTYREFGRLDEAERDYRKTISLLEGQKKSRGNDPVLAYCYLNLADIRRRRGDAAGADRDMLALARSGPIARMLLNDEKLLAVLDRMIPRNPREAELYSARGQIHMLAQRWAPARDDFTKVISLSKDPKARRTALANRGECHRRLGKLDDALADLDRAQAYSESLFVHEVRAKIHEARHNWLGAADAYTGCLRLAAKDSPHQRRALLRRSEAWRNAGRYDKALADADALVRQAPKNAEALGLRAVALVELRRDAEANADLLEVKKLDPKRFTRVLAPRVRNALERRQKADAALPTDPDVLATCYRCGRLWTMALLFNALSKDKKQAPALLASARKDAAVLGLSLPDLPSRQDVPAKDVLAALDLFGKNRGALSAAVAKRHGHRAARHFDLAAEVNILTMIYRAHNTRRNRALATDIRRNGRGSGLPASLWSPLTDKVDADADYKDVLALAVKLHTGALTHLREAARHSMGK